MGPASHREYELAHAPPATILSLLSTPSQGAKEQKEGVAANVCGPPVLRVAAQSVCSEVLDGQEANPVTFAGTRMQTRRFRSYVSPEPFGEWCGVRRSNSSGASVNADPYRDLVFLHPFGIQGVLNRLPN